MSLINHIIKEITQNQHQMLNTMGFDVVENISLNEYEIVLLYHPNFYGNDLKYTIGFQRKGRNFLDPFDQNSKQEIDDINFKDLIKIPPILKRWMNQYGKLVIGSYNQQKTNVYKKVFQRYNFDIEERNIQGINALIISL